MALINIQATKALTITGNGVDKTLLSIVEAQIKSIFHNNQATMGIRYSAVAESISEMQGVGTAIYRRPNRVVFGTDYNTDTGIKAQRTGAKWASVLLDQHLTINLPFEGFDLNRFLDSNPKVRATMVSEWIGSAVKNQIMNYELIFLRAIKDYSIAQYDKNPNGVLVLDLEALKTADEANDAYFKIATKKDELILAIDEAQVGTNLEDFIFAISWKGYTGLSRAMTKFVNTEAGLNTLATGQLFSDNVMGIPIMRHFLLNRDFDKDTNQRMNKDISFMLKGLQGVILNRNSIANPLGIQQTQMLPPVDSTLNNRYVSKNLGSLPVVLIPSGVVAILDKAPTTDEIAKAKLKVYDSENTDFTKSFKLAEYDNFKEVAPATEK